MVIERFVNNGQTTVAAAYAAGSTSLIVANAIKLPVLSGGDQFHIVVFTPDAPTNAEIMRVTAVVGNVLTVVPAVEVIGGISTSQNHPPGDTVANELSVDSITNLIEQLSLNETEANALYSLLGHTHDGIYYTEDEVDALLATKAELVHIHDDRYYTENEVDAFLAGKSDTNHTHDDRYYTETEIHALLTNKSDVGHIHDDRYYTESEVDAFLAGKSNVGHTHTADQITDFVAAVQVVGDARYAFTVHTHTASQITDFAAAVAAVGGGLYSPLGHIHDDRYYTETETNTLLAGKSNVGHTHLASDITNFVTAVQAVGDVRYAPISHTHTSAQITDFIEAAQDAVGNILVNSATINLTYNDAAPSIVGTVRTQMSVTSDGNGIKLVGDVTPVGTTKYYGTDVNGISGYYDLPVSTVEAEWLFSTNTTIADPGAGKFRTDQVGFATSTQMAISKESSANIDRTNLLKTLRTDDIISVQDKTNSVNWMRYRITAVPTNNTSWFLIPIVMIEGGGTAPNNNSATIFHFLQAGGGVGYTDEQAQDAAAAMILAGSHTGISFSYDDTGNALSAVVTGGGGGGLGDVSGPGSSTDMALARFDGTTGKLIQNSTVVLDDNGLLIHSLNTTATNAESIYSRINITTSNTAASGFGGIEEMRMELTDGSVRVAARTRTSWVGSAAAAYSARRTFETNVNGTNVESLRIEALAPGIAGIGFLGQNASAQLINPDVGTALNTFGLTAGTPTFSYANLTGVPASGSGFTGTIGD